MRKYYKLLLFLVFILPLAACEKNNQSDLSNEDLSSFIDLDKKTINILHVDDFTGDLEKERSRSAGVGIQAAVNYINDNRLLPHDFKFIIENWDLGKYDVNNSENKKSMYTNLKKKISQAGGVIGPLTSTDVLKVKPVLVGFDIPAILPVSTANGIAESNGNMYQLLPSNDILGINSTYINKQYNFKKVLLWYPKKSDSYTSCYIHAYKRYLKVFLKDVEIQSYTGDYEDALSIEGALNAAQKMNADTIFMPAFLKSSYTKVFNAMQNKGITIPIITGDSAYKIKKMPANLEMYFISYLDNNFPRKEDHFSEYKAYQSFIKSNSITSEDAAALYYLATLFMAEGYKNAINNALNLEQEFHSTPAFLKYLNDQLHVARIDSFIGLLDYAKADAKLDLEVSKIDDKGMKSLGKVKL